MAVSSGSWVAGLGFGLGSIGQNLTVVNFLSAVLTVVNI